MAVIGSIRKRSGLLVIIVGIALAAFVLGDFAKKRPRRHTYVGIINGEKITYNDFENKVSEQTELMQQQYKKENLSPRETFQARQNAWSILSSEIILNEQYKKLGVTVTTDELDDMVRGPNPHSYIKQFFRDPNTGQFNPSFVTNFLKNFEKVSPEDQKVWLRVEKAIKEERLNTKYTDLISKAYYIPQAMAKHRYENYNMQVKFRFFSVPYKSIQDSTISLTDEDYEKYYNKHNYEFYQEETRDVDYVVFDILPSQEDRKHIQELANKIYNEFIATPLKDVPTFVNRNSDPDQLYDSTFKKEGELPIQIDSLMFHAPIGTFSNLYVENEAYHMARLLDRQYRPDSMRASHILIAFQGANRAQKNITRSKEEAEKLADSILTVVRAEPDKFGELSTAFSDDPTAKKKEGDLDWFADGTMIGPFNEACLKGQIGDIVKVETVFGFHIIKITDKSPAIEKVRVARLKIAIEPSKQTYDRVYTEAAQFAGNNTTAEQFDKTVVEKGLNVRNAQYLTAMSDNIPGLMFPRNIVQWAFLESTKKGSVSLFDEQDKYVVAVLREIRNKGIAPLEQVRTRIEPLIIVEKKAEQSISKINEKTASINNIYKLASAFRSHVDTLDIIISSVNLPRYGPEPEVMGTVTTLKPGVLSQPIKGRSGVYVLLVDKDTEPKATEDFSMIKMQLDNLFTQRANSQIYNALLDAADIEDNRGMFY